MLRLLDGVAPRDIVRFRDGAWSYAHDELAVEEPLELRLAWGTPGCLQTRAISVTMRTPGNDFELAAGFLFAEGLVENTADIASIEHPVEIEDDEQRRNTVLVTLRPGLVPDLAGQQRNFTTTSACGVCGKASLDALVIRGCRPLPAGARILPATLMRLPGALRAAQTTFAATGGVHASGHFTLDGELLSLREDVGRHNALDKVVGQQFLAGNVAALADGVVVLSGRPSFELLQKALRARVPIVAAVGAPSSLAVQIAETFNITLAGFVRDGSFNVYAGRERIGE